MNKTILPVLAALTGLFQTANAQYSISQQTENTTVINFTRGEYMLSNASGSHVILDKEATPLLAKGSPDLKKYAFTVMLPDHGNPELTIEAGAYSEFTNIDILPSKGSLKRNVNPVDVPLTYSEAYNQDAFFPGTLGTINDPFIFRHTRGASVHVYPYQYNPITKVLRVYHSMKVTVRTDETKFGQNELSTTIIDGPAEGIYNQMYVNYTEMNSFTQRYTPIDEKGKMLIICPPSYATALDPLVAWKKQRGIETEVVTTTTTGTTQSSINTYIENYYNTHTDVIYVIIVGDHENIPAYNAGSTGSETKWSDSYYGFITGSDSYPEVFMGRLPAKTTAHVTSMVNKIIEYEKTPLAGSWYTTSIGIASDEGAGIGNDGEADWQHMRNIRTELMAFGYTTVHEFYDGSHSGADASGNPTSTMVANAVNTGASLFLYCGHGDLTSCVTSNYSVTNVNASTNYGKYPFVISVACNNGTLVGGECLTEVFMRASNTGGPTGSIAACGSSILMAWAEPMETEDEISKILSELYVSNRKYTLGGLFYNGQFSMLEDYPTSTGIEVMQTWIFFGDPSVMMRSKVPATMTVSAPSCFTNGSSFTVTGGINGADVALTQGTSILGSGVITGSSGSINITGATTGSATLTVSGYNQLPYIITVAQCATGTKDMINDAVKIYPNPATDLIMIDGIEGNFTYLVTDESGRKILVGNTTSSIDVSTLADGLYFITIVSELNGNTVQRFVKK